MTLSYLINKKELAFNKFKIPQLKKKQLFHCTRTNQ